MAKSDKSPEFYLPPNDSYQCQYVSYWMKVKAIWQLATTPQELSAIENVVKTHHCADSKLQMSNAELEDERDAIQSSVPSRCQEFGQVMWARSAQLELPLER